jgi:hypothetical protein
MIIVETNHFADFIYLFVVHLKKLSVYMTKPESTTVKIHSTKKIVKLSGCTDFNLK